MAEALDVPGAGRDASRQGDRYGLILDDLDVQAQGYQALLQMSFSQASGVQHGDGAIARATWVRADAVGHRPGDARGAAVFPAGPRRCPAPPES